MRVPVTSEIFIATARACARDIGDMDRDSTCVHLRCEHHNCDSMCLHLCVCDDLTVKAPAIALAALRMLTTQISLRKQKSQALQ